MRLTAFQTRYSNLIESAQIAPNLYAADNVGRAKVQGLEAAWTGQIGLADVRASFTVQNPINLDTDTDLLRQARHFMALSVNRSIADWRLGAQWLVSGARNDVSNLGGYGIVNLTARYNITKSWYWVASLENVFNKRYELVYTYNTPGRSAYLTLGWSPK
jgi:vitamin B12 transporter